MASDLLTLRDKVISDFSISLDLDTFKEVLEWLPSELRQRIIDPASLEKIGQKHPAGRWAVFNEEKESEKDLHTSELL